ncbi:MAG: hypothetical protein VW879_04285, partial [Opitutae bacterium]
MRNSCKALTITAYLGLAYIARLFAQNELGETILNDSGTSEAINDQQEISGETLDLNDPDYTKDPINPEDPT